MSRTKAVLGVCLIFLFGLICGVGLSVKLVDWRIRQMVRDAPGSLGQIVVRRLDHELELDALQRDKVHAIVAENREQMRAIHRENQPRMEKIMDEATRRIREVLRPAQQEKFDVMVSEGRHLGRPRRSRAMPRDRQEHPPRSNRGKHPPSPPEGGPSEGHDAA